MRDCAIVPVMPPGAVRLSQCREVLRSLHAKLTTDNRQLTTAAEPLSMNYQVQLEVYSGPLDLLLYLVRRQELDILHLPIAKIASEFLKFFEVLQELDLDEIGEFVVMASALLEIKSRLVLPGTEEAAAVETPLEDPADPRADLVRQLLEYKRFKDASRLLEEQSSEWRLRFPRLSDDSPEDGSDPTQDRIREVELWDLVSALTRVLHQNTESAPKSIVYDDTPISTYVERIRARVLTEERVAFTSFFEEATYKSKVIGIFLAILELLRHYHFRAEQPEDYHEIWILPPLEPVAILVESNEAETAPPS
jgi:segregation and condensation protein A